MLLLASTLSLAAPPQRISYAVYSGVEGEPGEMPAVSLPFPVPWSQRMSWSDGWGLDLDSSARLAPNFDLTARFTVYWSPLPKGRFVPYALAGVAFGDRDVPRHEGGGRMGLGPALSVGVEAWLTPRVAVDAVLGTDLIWAAPLDSAAWQLSGDYSARLGVRFMIPILVPPVSPA